MTGAGASSMPDHRDPTKTAITFYPDRDLKEQFAAAAQRKGETMTTALTRFMRDYTRRNKR
jgi:hypothetical protein